MKLKLFLCLILGWSLWLFAAIDPVLWDEINQANHHSKLCYIEHEVSNDYTSEYYFKKASLAIEGSKLNYTVLQTPTSSIILNEQSIITQYHSHHDKRSRQKKESLFTQTTYGLFSLAGLEPYLDVSISKKTFRKIVLEIKTKNHDFTPQLDKLILTLNRKSKKFLSADFYVNGQKFKESKMNYQVRDRRSLGEGGPTYYETTIFDKNNTPHAKTKTTYVLCEDRQFPPQVFEAH